MKDRIRGITLTPPFDTSSIPPPLDLYKVVDGFRGPYSEQVLATMKAEYVGPDAGAFDFQRLEAAIADESDTAIAKFFMDLGAEQVAKLNRKFDELTAAVKK